MAADVTAVDDPRSLLHRSKTRLSATNSLAGVTDQLVTNDDEPVLNWYQHVFAAAARFSPPQARELGMPTCADVTFDRRQGVGSDPVGPAPV